MIDRNPESVVAVTGASGFIGGHVCNELGAHCKVRALLRNPPAVAGEVEVVHGALEDRAAVEQLVTGASVVVHIAGVVRGRRLAHFATNYGGTLALVSAMERVNPTARLLLISSLAARQPTVSAYAASKKAAELAVAASSLQWSILRPPAVYGPGDRELQDLFNAMFRGVGIHPATTGRTAVVHVRDLARAVQAVVSHAAADGHILEVDDGHPNGYRWADIIGIAERVRGRPILRVPVPRWLLRLLAAMNDGWSRVAGYHPMLTAGKVQELFHPDWVTDTTLLRELTGWQPTVDLATGLQGLRGCPAGAEPTSGKTNSPDCTAEHGHDSHLQG